MKKFMRNCGICALVMILVGIVMVSMAGVLKGPEVVASVKNYISDGIAQLDSGVRFDIENDLDFNSDVPVLTGAVRETYSANQVDSIDIEVGTCQLYIEQSADADFHVNMEGTGNYQGFISDNTLSIKAICATGIGANVSMEDSGFNVSLDTAACELHLQVPVDFQFEKVTISLGAGELIGEALLKTQELEIELAAGEIDLPNLEVSKLDAEVGAGVLCLGGTVLEKADLECGMGDVELALAGNEQDFNYQVEVAAGEVTIGRESFGGIAGERDVDNGADKDINIECAMGNVQVTFSPQ